VDSPIALLDRYPTLPWKDKLAYLVWRFLTIEQKDTPVTHLFEPGKYIREMTIPPDTLFIGRQHRHGHEVQLLSGSVIQITEHGKRQVDAPFTVHTQPGDQMVAYIIGNVVCRSIHPNPDDSRDVEALELDAFHPVDELTTLGLQVSQKLESGTWLE
jgi:hypothetical protein